MNHLPPLAIAPPRRPLVSPLAASPASFSTAMAVLKFSSLKSPCKVYFDCDFSSTVYIS